MSTSAAVDDTYTVRPGAHNNAGGRYECLMDSYVALKLLQSSTSNFKVSNNSEEYGDFDDVIVEILENDSATECWAIQLKHRDNEEEITKQELGAPQGKLSLKRFFEDYHQRHLLAKPVFFTNRKFSEGVSVQIEGKPYVLTSFKSRHATCLFNTSEDDTVFQFDIKLETARAVAGDAEEFEQWQMFLKTFYLCANQKSVDEFDREVSRLFTTALGFVDEVEGYKKLFEKYWAEKPVAGKKRKLQREEIEREVARIVLRPYARPTIDLKVNSAEENMLKTIISKFDVTLIDADCGEAIANLWQRSDSDVPLIVPVSEAKADSICKVLNVLTPGKHNFLLVGGNCVNPDKLTNWKVFEKLSNLKSDDYKTIKDKFCCIVQGRKKTCLGEILNGNEKLSDFIKVGHLLRMIDNNKPFVIGDETVTLPTPYIHRSIPKHVFSCDLIGNLDHGDVLVISCGDVNKLLAMVNKHKNYSTKVVNITNRNFIIEPTAGPMILISKDKRPLAKFNEICSKIKDVESSVERVVLNFEFFDNSLNLLSTHGALSRFIKFRKMNTTDDIVKELEILTNFMNKTNVLLADPGMGKTVCGDFIKQVCPFDAWPVKINLREKLTLLANSTSVQDLLTKILDTDQSDLLKRSFQDYYSNDRHLMLIWDGLDEVGTENVETVLKKIKEISLVTRHYQWITSRYHLQKELESCFNILSVTLNQITSNDQREYIEETLRDVYSPETIRDVTVDIHQRIVKNNLKDMLGIPLLLNMFTTICSKPDNYERIRENELSLTQIYGMFIDAKFLNHSREKIGNVENPVLRQICDEHKAFRVIKYSRVALLTCFNHDFLEELNLNCDGFLQEIAVTGDCIGLITTITDNNNAPIFLHKTFAEYFAALHLSKEHKQLGPEILKQLLFRPEHKNIRFLFDMCLSENHPAHQAVLMMNLEKLKEIAEKNKDMILWRDEGGRTLLHLACSYGVRRPPLRSLNSEDLKAAFMYEYKESDAKTFDATPLHSLEKENKDYENIVNYLVSSVTEQETINDTDTIYGLNCVEYADASLSLYAIDGLLKIICEDELENFLHFLRNYKDTETLLAYSIVLSFENLSSVFDSIPYFELVRPGVRLSRFEMSTTLYHARFEDLTTYSILILIIEFGCIGLLRKALKNECVKRMKDKMYSQLHDCYQIDPLVWAVKKGNFDIFNLILENKPDLGGKYDTKDTNILHIAVELRQTNIVKHIINEKLIKIDTRNRSGKTPLLIASKTGDLDIIIYLIAKGANVGARNSHGENLFHIAAVKGHLKIVQYLVQNNKILQETLDSSGNTPMLMAASEGHFDIVECLQENGANVKAKNKIGQNILHYACLEGNLSFIKRITKENLIELDTQDLYGNNPLLEAAATMHFDIVEYLLENGANVKAKNKIRQNILHYACSGGNLPFIKRLTIKENLIELDTQDDYGHNPLLEAAATKHFDIVEYLLENGANVKAKNKIGQNILHYACSKENLPFIKRLTKEHLIELDTQDDDGHNPLLKAASRNRFDIVKYLLENGANFKVKNIHKHNILHFADRYGLSKEFLRSLKPEDLKELQRY